MDDKKDYSSACMCLFVTRQAVIILCDLLPSLCIHQHIHHTGTLSHISESAITVLLLDENRFISDVLAAVVRSDSGLCCLSSKMSQRVALGLRITGNSTISP